MSQPMRVEGWAYMPGSRVNLRLQFRSQSTYARVKAQFHNPSGQVIKLEGVTHTREESGAPRTEVVLTGNVPENAALGTYECRSPWRGSPARGGWRPSSKTPPSTSAWSKDHSTPKVGESSSASSQRRGR
jgi:hypothetical protein